MYELSQPDGAPQGGLFPVSESIRRGRGGVRAGEERFDIPGCVTSVNFISRTGEF